MSDAPTRADLNRRLAATSHLGLETKGASTIEEVAARDQRAVVRPQRFAATGPPLPPGVMRAGRARLYDLSTYRPDVEAATTDFLIKDWIVRGQVHVFVGGEKKGKSTQQWHRITAVSSGGDYHGLKAVKGRVLAVTEMADEVIEGLLADDGIEPDWTQVRVAFIDEMPREERLATIGDAVQEWKPDYLALDPLDECFGLDEKGIFNPSTTADGFQLLGQWTTKGITVDATYHYNNLGKIANSYKFRSKPDHIYQIKGSEASDVTIEYQGRLRAIPRKRRLQGDGENGYMITVIAGGVGGRPAESREVIRRVLAGSTVPLPPVEISKQTGVRYNATQKALARGVQAGVFERVGVGYQLKGDSDANSLMPSPPVSSLSADLNPKRNDETTPYIDKEGFVTVDDQMPFRVDEDVTVTK
jgi:hypothetical protein